MNTDSNLVALRNPYQSQALATAPLAQERQRILRWGLGCAFALLLGACAHSGAELTEEQASRLAAQVLQSQRENQLKSAWGGRPYNALLESFGAPILTMNVLGYRPQKTSLVVYGMLDSNANCVDSFTMVKDEQSGEWTVADYFCR